MTHRACMLLTASARRFHRPCIANKVLRNEAATKDTACDPKVEQFASARSCPCRAPDLLMNHLLQMRSQRHERWRRVDVQSHFLSRVSLKMSLHHQFPCVTVAAALPRATHALCYKTGIFLNHQKRHSMHTHSFAVVTVFRPTLNFYFIPYTHAVCLPTVEWIRVVSVSTVCRLVVRCLSKIQENPV